MTDTDSPGLRPSRVFGQLDDAHAEHTLPDGAFRLLSVVAPDRIRGPRRSVLKIKPFEYFVVEGEAYSFTGNRADESREGFLGTAQRPSDGGPNSPRSKGSPKRGSLVRVRMSPRNGSSSLDHLITKSTPQENSVRKESAALDDLRNLCQSPGYAHVIAVYWMRGNMVLAPDGKRTPEGLAKRSTELTRREIDILVGLAVQGEFDFALADTHPKLFERAQQYEKVDPSTGKRFTWGHGATLDEILAQREQIEAATATKKSNSVITWQDRLLEDDDVDKACLICTL